MDGLLTLNLNGILSTFKTKISCLEYDLSHSLLFLGSESGKIYVCNKSILDIQSNKKMKSVPNVQEYYAHSTQVTKLKWSNFKLTSVSSVNDG
jgi:hypothetical protein